jgi:small-conductance mechanosensitive channel
VIIKKFNHLKITNPNAARFALSFVVFLLLVIMGLAVVVKKNTDAKDASRQIGHLKVLSNQMESYLKPARLGEVSAFIGLRQAAQAFDGQWQEFKQQHPYAPVELKAVDETWQRMNSNTKAFGDGYKVMVIYKDILEKWHQTKRQLDALNNQLVEVLLLAHASPAQLALVKNQEVISEAMLREWDNPPDGNMSTSEFAPNYADDYFQALNGLLQGDKELDVDRVTQPEARKILTTMIALFDEGVTKQGNTALELSSEIFQVDEASAAIWRDRPTLHQQLKQLESKQSYTTTTVIIIIFSALCAMVSLGGYLRAIKPIASALPK